MNLIFFPLLSIHKISLFILSSLTVMCRRHRIIFHFLIYLKVMKKMLFIMLTCLLVSFTPVASLHLSSSPARRRGSDGRRSVCLNQLYHMKNWLVPTRYESLPHTRCLYAFSLTVVVLLLLLSLMIYTVLQLYVSSHVADLIFGEGREAFRWSCMKKTIKLADCFFMSDSVIFSCWCRNR